jgi:hypothetical protein
MKLTGWLVARFETSVLETAGRHWVSWIISSFTSRRFWTV